MKRYRAISAAMGLALTLGLVNATVARAGFAGNVLVENGFGSLCLDAEDDSGGNPLVNGDKVQLWTCDGGPNQRWYFNEASGNFGTITNAASGKCLDAATDPSTNPTIPGDRVQLWDCKSGAQQQLWAPFFFNYDIHGNPIYTIENRYGDLFLDAENDPQSNPTVRGDKVQVWTPNNSSQQLWDLNL